MTAPTRRAVIAGGAALLLARPLHAAPIGADDDLRAVLDALPRRDPVAALGQLARFDPAALSLPARLDLMTVRTGLAIDGEIARRFPTADSRQPRDPAYYQLLLRRRLGDGIVLSAARRRLARELARQSRRADGLLRRLGLREGSIGARFTALFADPHHLYSDDEAGRDRAVADMNRMLAEQRARIDRGFESVPAWCLDVEARRTSRAAEIAGRSGRRELPAPGLRGAYYIDLARITSRPAWTLPSVVAHELLPGHMIQLPIEAAARPHPLRLEYAPAFAEGWAIYAEQYAADDGAFDGDPLATLGHVHWLLFRLGRALVDCAIHLDGWPLAQARAFLEQRQGPPAYFAPFDTELTRIAAEPTARAAEALCWLSIADHAPRDPARRKAFHAGLLAGGRRSGLFRS